MNPVAPNLTASLQTALGTQYRLERELGRGGMGVVYLARDLTLDRTVAVKVISPELAFNRNLAERFLAEARLIARIRHPNIVTVYAAGTADGLLYYVMDHVAGESLRDLLQREGRLEPPVAIKLAADIAAALDAAAHAGVVHRDVKPENILVEQSGSGPRALLADFGIAHVMREEVGTTGPGMAMGTPAYMSPEQAAGEVVDARSDLYSLGVVAFEMLAGRPPFEGPRRIVISRQIVDPPPALTRLRPDVPRQVAAAIARALEKVPEERWQTGESFRAGLLGLVDVPRPRRRRRLALLAATAGIVALALGLAFRRDGPPAGVDPRHSYLVLPFANLREDDAIGWLAAGSVSMLDLALSQWRELKVVSHERVHDLMDDAGAVEGGVVGLDRARRLARQAGVWTVVLGAFTRTGDSLSLVARAYDVASGARLEVAEVRGHLREDVRPLFDELAARLLDLSGAPRAGRTDLATATSASLEAYRRYLEGLEQLNRWNLDDAERAFREAVALDSTFSLAFFRLAVTRGWISNAPDSLTMQFLADATRYADRLPPREQQTITAYRGIIEGDYTRAQTLYAELVARDSADAESWYGLGDAWFHDMAHADRAGALTQSLRAFRQAVAIDPRMALAYEHMNAMLTQAARPDPSYALVPGDRFIRTKDPEGRPALAAVALDQAVAHARREAVGLARQWTEYQPETLRAHRALLEAHLAADDVPAALDQVARIRGVPEEGARDLAGFLEARIRLTQGDAIGAARLLRQILAALDPASLRASGMGQELIWDVLAGANVFAYVGDIEGAAAVIRIAEDLRRLILPPGAIVDPFGDDRVWQAGRLSALYSAVGVPPFELRDLWARVARVAQSATERERPLLAWAGASAAQGLLVGDAADPTAVHELQRLTGVPPRPEFQALAALARGDSAGARRALAAPPPEETRDPKPPNLNQTAAFSMGDARPVAAQVHFQLGNYREALALLERFEVERLFDRGFDPRWGLLARVRLLRGLAHERLGHAREADLEFERVVTQWEGADERLMPVVREARAGLARIKGAKG